MVDCRIYDTSNNSCVANCLIAHRASRSRSLGSTDLRASGSINGIVIDRRFCVWESLFPGNIRILEI
jgi:hypothetical protein